MNEDVILLRRFVDRHAEEAFTELVQRHRPMVYATALRRVGGDSHLAQDVAQTVFISLARNAASLRDHASIAGWLYVSAHHATAEVVRREQRRKQRETSAHAMNLASQSDDPPIDPASLRPLLDDALIELKADDREAVVLRFFAQRSFAEIGTALRITEEAARKRVNRALDQLQAALSRRGVTSTATALSGALTVAGATTVPATLVGQVAVTALAQAGALPATTLATSLMSSLLPAAGVAAVLTGLWTIIPQQRANAAMADSIARLEHATKTAAGVRRDINDLTRALADARTPSVGIRPAPIPARSVQHPSATRVTSANTKEVFITSEGSLEWEGEPVTLDEFVVHLARYQQAAARSGSQLIVKGNGVQYSQLNYVLEEARKAGITSLVVESDSEPDPAVPTTWF